MDLVRNTTPDGSCKYRLWNNERQEWVYDDKPGDEHEFFVIMLKDINAPAALEAYAQSIREKDPEFSRQITELAHRAGKNHPDCQDPD